MANTAKKRVSRLGDMFGGLLGGAIKSLKTGGTPGGRSKKNKKKKLTRKQILDSL